MRAGLLTAPATWTPVEVPAPDPAALPDGEVLVRVLAGGICGSDLPAFYRRHGGAVLSTAIGKYV